MALKLSQTHFILSSSYSSVRRRLLSSVSAFSSSYDEYESTTYLPKLEPSTDADSLSQLLLNHHNPFHSSESSLQLHGVSISVHLLDQTLLRLRNFTKIALSFFHHTQSLPSPPSSTTTYNLIIDILAKVRQFDVAWQLIVEMDNKNIKISSHTFLILIRRLISANLTRQAVRAFDDMPAFLDDDVKIGTDDFRFLLDTLCKYGHVKVAAEVFNTRRREFEVDAKVYTVLIDGWCKMKRFNMAERFFNEMIDKGIEPTVVTYNVMLNGVCRNASLHPEERFEKTIRNAEKLFDEMHQRGIEPDVSSFSIVLHVYSRAHKPDLTLDKLKTMKSKGICPTVATYTSVIKCLCSCGRLEDAELLLTEMEINGVSPSSATYNCFFKEYRGRKDAVNALKLYRKMKEDGLCLLGSQTYNILLGMFMKLNDFEIVTEIWDDMKTSGVGPDLDSYTLLVHGLCEKQKWKEGCRYFVEMIELGFLPQKITFETLYKGLIQSDKLRTWRRLKKKLDEESVTFGSEFKDYHFKPYKR